MIDWIHSISQWFQKSWFNSEPFAIYVTLTASIISFFVNKNINRNDKKEKNKEIENQKEDYINLISQELLEIQYKIKIDIMDDIDNLDYFINNKAINNSIKLYFNNKQYINYLYNFKTTIFGKNFPISTEILNDVIMINSISNYYIQRMNIQNEILKVDNTQQYTKFIKIILYLAKHYNIRQDYIQTLENLYNKYEKIGNTINQ